MDMEQLKPFVYIFLFLFDLYAFVHLYVMPWLFIAAIVITLAAIFPDKFLSLLYKIRKPRVKPERRIEIPEGTPQTIPVPEIPEKLEPTQETIRKLVDALKKSNENLMLLQSQIAELRRENDKLKRENEEAKRTAELVERWLNGKDVKEYLKQMTATFFLKGAPVTNKRGDKLGKLVAIVPNPLGKGLMLITEDARGVLKPVGWGMTWADENYYPLIDPKCWEEIQKEMRDWDITMIGGEKSLTVQYSPIKEHVLVLSEHAEKVPAYIDPYAELEHGPPSGGIRVDDPDAAEVIRRQRDEIDRLKKINNQLYHRLEMVQRQAEYLRNVASAMALHLSDMEAKMNRMPTTTVDLLEELEVESEKAELQRKRADTLEMMKRMGEEVAERELGKTVSEAYRLAQTDRIDLVKKTLGEIEDILRRMRESPEELLAKAVASAAVRAEEKKEGGGEGG